MDFNQLPPSGVSKGTINLWETEFNAEYNRRAAKRVRVSDEDTAANIEGFIQFCVVLFGITAYLFRVFMKHGAPKLLGYLKEKKLIGVPRWDDTIVEATLVEPPLSSKEIEEAQLRASGKSKYSQYVKWDEE